MIGKVTRGSDVGGLLRYLYGPGRANEHTDAHLVASWLGDEPNVLQFLEPEHSIGRQRFADLTDRLTLPLAQLPAVPSKQVWQCSMRLADTDRHLTDAEWAQVARQVVETTGFAPVGDEGGCRWVAVRHADDHIHIAVILARQDGAPVNTFRDWPKVHAAARAVEQRFGLTTVPSPDHTATSTPKRAESEKAARRGRPEPPRVWLTRQVRAAAAGSTSSEDFRRLLDDNFMMRVSWRYSTQTPDQITGFRVGQAGDSDARGEQVWFSGSRLSPDLSFPKIAARWTTTPRAPRASMAFERTVIALHGTAGGPIDRATAMAAGDLASVLAHSVEGGRPGPLGQAAEHLSLSARLPHGRQPTNGHPLLRLAADLAAAGRPDPDQHAQVLHIVQSLIRIATALKNQPAAKATHNFTHYYDVTTARRVAMRGPGVAPATRSPTRPPTPPRSRGR